MKTKQLTIDAMLAAMCAVLGYISIDTGTVKVTFESLPVIIGALMFGPIDGMLIGGIGTFIYQAVRFGVELSTPLWIIPYVITGFITGYIAKRGNYSLSEGKMRYAIVQNEVLLLILNTVSLYIYFIYILDMTGYVVSALPLRLAICAVKSVAYAVIVPMLIKAVKGAVRG